MYPERKRQGITLIELLLGALIVLTLVQAAMPLLVQAREDGRTQECVRNLRAIQKAKADWGRDHPEQAGGEPTDRDLFGPGRYLSRKPVCPSGGTYHVNALGEKASCSVVPRPDPYPHRLGN
jgi:type II secretory pathway pseudopilin PulG